MTARDRWGVPLEAPDGSSLEGLEEAIVSLCLMRGQPSAVLDELAQNTPNWALVDIFRSYLDLYAETPEGNQLARDRLSRAVGPAVSAGPREHAHQTAAMQWLSGDLPGALATLATWLSEQPRDLLALRVSQDLAFFLGDQGALCDISDHALRSWSDVDPERGLILGMVAFGLEEQGSYREAEDHARRALEVDPTDAWSTHALAHVMEMEGRSEEGAAFLQTTAPAWSPSFFASHNWWHLALFMLELDALDDAIELLHGPISAAGSEVWFEIVNQASLLWRLSLVGADAGPPSPALTTVLRGRTSQTLSAFNALHAIAALSLAGDDEAVDALIAASADDVRQPIARLVFGGFAAFGNAQWDKAAQLLGAARNNSVGLGGSNAQRDLIDQTLLMTVVRNGGPDQLIDELIATHPSRWSTSTTERLTMRRPPASVT